MPRYSNAPSPYAAVTDRISPMVTRLASLFSAGPMDPTPMTTVGPGAIPLYKRLDYLRKVLGESVEDVARSGRYNHPEFDRFTHTLEEANPARTEFEDELANPVDAKIWEMTNHAADQPGAVSAYSSWPTKIIGPGEGRPKAEWGQALDEIYDPYTRMVNRLADLFIKSSIIGPHR